MVADIIENINRSPKNKGVPTTENVDSTKEKGSATKLEPAKMIIIEEDKTYKTEETEELQELEELKEEVPEIEETKEYLLIILFYCIFIEH